MSEPLIDARPAGDAPVRGRRPVLSACDLLACAGVAGLFFLRPWFELQATYTDFIAYFRSRTPGASLPGALLLVALGFAALAGTALAMANRNKHRWARLGRFLFLLVLASAAPGTLIRMSSPYNGWAAAAEHLLDSAWLGAGLCCAALVWTGADRIFRAARAVAVLIAPMFLLVVGNVAFAHWSASRVSAAGRYESAAAPRLVSPSGGARLLVLIFDELDYRLAFAARPQGVRMPAFDRLRGEALWAGNALPPARWTFHSVPMLLTGRRAMRAPESEPALRFGGMELPARWGRFSNLFTGARAAGARTALVGWFHPYCGVLAGALDSCWSLPCGDVTDAQRLQEFCSEAGTLACAHHILRRHPYSLRPSGPARGAAVRRELQALRKWNLQGYLETRKRLLKLATDSSYRLVVAHLPIPHPLGIFDRRTGRLTTDERSNYFDNLELADRLLAEVRAAMERAGMWDAAAVIVTSDHGLRPEVWNHRPTWTAEEAAAVRSGTSLLVPLAVKLPGPSGRPQPYAEPLNVVIVHDLSLALLRGAIPGYADLRAWLDSNRERTSVPESDVARSFGPGRDPASPHAYGGVQPQRFTGSP